ncbi:hypothetical protein SLA2020_187860 [Shorea laevis]
MSLQEGTETHPSNKIKATSMIIGIHATITISIPLVLADADDDDAPQRLVGFASCHGPALGWMSYSLRTASVATEILD